MEVLTNFFNLVLYRPLFNALIILYEYLPGHDFGIAVIILTILIKLALYPLGIKAIKSQKFLQEIQPKIQEIQEKYKNNKEKLARETMELYKKEGVNPFSGCLSLLVQLPILVALYKVFLKGLQAKEMIYLYSFVPVPEAINPSFLGVLNLSKSFIIKTQGKIEYYWPVLGLAILAGVLQFFQTKMTTPSSFKKNQSLKTKKGTPDFSEMIQNQMIYFFPVFTIFILLSLPAALALYWIVNSFFSIFQQFLIFRKIL